jgi:hypothetical protein
MPPDRDHVADGDRVDSCPGFTGAESNLVFEKEFDVIITFDPCIASEVYDDGTRGDV